MIILFLTIGALGFVIWAFNYLVPMDQKFKTILIALACVYVFLLILQAFGLIHGVPAFK